MSNNRKILIIDDNIDFLENLFLIFSDAGYLVETASSGMDALLKVNNSYNLIITDFRMPGMDGLVFLKKVKNLFPNIPVIIITGFSSTGIISEALQSGAINFFEKPFDSADLLAYTETVINQFFEHKELPDQIKELLFSSNRSISLKSSEKILEWVPSIVMKDLLNFGFCKEEDILGLSTALIEAVANALYHGNFEINSDVRNDGSLDGQMQFKTQVAGREKDPVYNQKRIVISYNCDPEKIKITIIDEGRGFDWRNQLSKGFSMFSGKGIFLINSLVDKAEYNEKGNEVSLTKFLKK